MGTARWFLVIGVASVRPFDDLEMRGAGSANVALKAAVSVTDDDGVSRASMGLGPAVEDGSRTLLVEMPAVKRALGNPVSSRGNDQIGFSEQIGVVRNQMMQTAGARLDDQMGVIGLESLGQALGLVASDVGRAERVASDVRPAQRLRIDQHNAPDARLGESAGDGASYRAAADHHDRRPEKAARARILSPSVHPVGVGALHEGPDNRGSAKEAPQKERLRRVTRPEPQGKRLVRETRPPL